MTKQQIAQQLKEEFQKGNLKPSQLKKSKSTGDLPATNIPVNQSQPRRKSVDLLNNPQSLTKLLTEAHDQISILELKLETQARELEELKSLPEKIELLQKQKEDSAKQNKNLGEQIKNLQKQLEQVNSELTQTKQELDNSLLARHASLKDFNKEHEKRVKAEKELDENIEQAASELTKTDQENTHLKTQLLQANRQISQLQRDLNLVKLRGNLTYPAADFSFSLPQLKYALYALLAIWFCLLLKRRDND